MKGQNNGGADGLSRLPLPYSSAKVETGDYFHFMVEDHVPLDADQIRAELRRDIVLSKVYLYVRDGWPDSVEEEMKPYLARAREISIGKNVLM